MRTLHVISHTHWDREWYLPFESHRRRLVQLMDGLLDLLDRDPDFHHFHMDGQFIPIEDYLAMRPGARERIRAAAQAGRLSVGPWYVLQDEYLTSAEAQVRNMQIGMRLAREFADPILLGYLPDSFGNIGQMPQILRGFGIDNAVFGRGINRRNPNAPPDATPEERGYASELLWSSPDGSEVLGIFFANWYANAMVIPTDDSCVAVVERIRDACLRYATTSHLLLMNGCDHTPSQPDVSAAIARANRSMTEDRLVHSNFTDYLAAVRSEAKGLQRVEGELRSRFTDGWGTLTNVLSSRLYEKQANWRCQTGLEKWVEPFGAMADLLGTPYDREYAEFAWKLLLENHPHDSICGCSADPVHREVDIRFAKCEAVAEDMARDALLAVGARIDTASMGDGSDTPDNAPDRLGDAAYVVLYNPTNIDRRETIEIAVDFADETLCLDVSATDADGAPVECVFLDAARTWDYHLPDVGFRVPYHAVRARVLVLADVPSFGYATLRFAALAESRQSAEPDEPRTTGSLRVNVHEDGTINLQDAATGVAFDGLHVLEDSLDVGDEYNYRAPAEDQVVRLRNATVQTVESNRLRKRIEIRGELPVEDGSLGVVSELTLAEGAPYLAVRTTIKNGKRDHRLRALFPARVQATESSADGQFEVVRRPITTWRGWKNPSNCHPCQAFVDVSDEHRGLTIANRGLPEYEVLQDGKATVAITLLRASGRIGDWGVFPTEDSQSIGSNVAEYAIIPHAGTLEASGAALAARLYNAPIRSVQMGRHGGELAARGAFLRLNPAQLVLSAVKPSDAGGSVIVRFYNPFAEPVDAELEIGFPVAEVHRARLDETREEPCEIADGRVRLAVPGFKIVTLELVKGSC
ncbi:alpha-mannosidase [Candidatus Poribacteria bacterium]|nr:alpha-mannosidase [Candidatus Poribacteria bacterium]